MKEEYIEYSQLYGNKTEMTEKSLRDLEKKIRSNEQTGTENIWIQTFSKYNNITELDRLSVVEMIKKILIDKDGGISVIFRFEDQISAILNEFNEEEFKYAQG